MAPAAKLDKQMAYFNLAYTEQNGEGLIPVRGKLGGASPSHQAFD